MRLSRPSDGVSHKSSPRSAAAVTTVRPRPGPARSQWPFRTWPSQCRAATRSPLRRSTPTRLYKTRSDLLDWIAPVIKLLLELGRLGLRIRWMITMWAPRLV
jgi:hypothetical protein